MDAGSLFTGTGRSESPPNLQDTGCDGISTPWQPRGCSAASLGPIDGSRNLLRFLQNLAKHRGDRFHLSCAFAVWARCAQRPFQTLLDLLSSNRHRAEIIKLKDLVGSAIKSHALFQSGHHTGSILALIHIDEVNHDDDRQLICDGT